jgi:hypothetical protein
MNGGISRIIAIVFVVAFIIIFAWAMTQEGSPSEGNVTYDSQKGIIYIQFDDPLPSADWSAEIWYYQWDSQSSTSHRVYLTTDADVILSEGGHKVAISEGNLLVNLSNDTYDIQLKAPGQSEIYCSFTFNDHVFSTEEIIVIALVFSLFAIAIVIVVIRRLVRGHW